MLIRFKKNLEKIAMGLLSFMPDEKKDVKRLQFTIKEYEANPDWQLFLWKEDDDVLGAIGIRIEDNKDAIIQHISVNPSHRNQGLGKRMVNELKQQFLDQYNIYPADEIREFYSKCNDKQSEPNEQ
ncbi:N-acetyltransferase [Oceanobacillus piezotolerans]|uniref:N-acetyltransferase n=1 Tax=Oceanobacillus piezotolerans TaxID=2448030 RepID=A0A498DM85_9BACI|nr:GNAT family N-acetyltransferase [Oceanobacillus piezotolerans]RLL48160.1 N-acetyltransferase [Oceanobacillus piezotolerans]